ncbi:MAG: cation diffusion facilitator family transporter [Bacteroidales bacterium]|nr:cation diffusion facilitator family transporter [Bacteroidales bacterium]
MLDQDRTRIIIRASWVAVIANALLATLKINVGFLAGSLALVGDGIDSASDIITSIITLYTAKLITKPPNLKFPYGYRKADAVASKALSFVVFFAGAQLAITTINRLIEGGSREVPEIFAIYVVIISIVGKLLLSWYLLKTGKNLESPMLIANGRNMKNDVMISTSVLAGLFFTVVLKMPVIDSIFALLISIYIMKAAFDIFMETNIELMDGVKDEGVYGKIIDAIKKVKGAYNPHRIRVRKTSNMYVVAVDIEVDPDLKISEAHEIALLVEKSLKASLINVFDILVHVEPLGNIEKDEIDGISVKDIK